MRRATAFLFVLVSIVTGTSAESQESRGKNYENRIELKGTLGYSNFVDDSPLRHVVTGGAARIRILSGLGLEPELTYMYRSQRDRDFLLIPNLIYEFGRQGRVIPYFIGGAGLLNHRETWNTLKLSVKGWVYQGGFGTKVFLNQRVFVAPEVRIGWEPHIRVTATLGYVLRK